MFFCMLIISTYPVDVAIAGDIQRYMRYSEV